MEDPLFKKISKDIYLNRKKDAIKNDYKKALYIVGSKKYPLCASIVSKYASFSGNGFNAFSLIDEIYPFLLSTINPCHIFELLDNKNESFIYNTEQFKHINDTYQAVLFGNGIKETDENCLFLSHLIKEYTGFLVVDASGINLLSNNPDILLSKNKKSEIILTPHLGEFKRLTKVSDRGRIPTNYINEAKEFSKKYHVSLILKSFSSLHISNNVCFFNESSSPSQALAKAGSGDAFAGLLTGYFSYLKERYSIIEISTYADDFIHRLSSFVMKKAPVGYLDVYSMSDYIIEFINSIVA